MNVLSTRTLSWSDGAENKELALTIFTPFEVNEYHWKCGFVTDPPIRPQVVYGVGIDFLHAFVECLRVARLHFETFERWRRLHWEGMRDCGMPSFARGPASVGSNATPPPVPSEGKLGVLSTRSVGYRDEAGVERQRELTVFAPLRADDNGWRCGFTFEPLPHASVRYGAGADFIEALLDALALARTVYDTTIATRRDGNEELLDCDDFPYKTGRSFWMSSSGEQPADPSETPTP